MAAAGLTPDPAALSYLLANLGGDRALTRSELDKLVLYVGKGPRVTLADAAAMVGDSAERTLDDLSHAVAGGDVGGGAVGGGDVGAGLVAGGTVVRLGAVVVVVLPPGTVVVGFGAVVGGGTVVPAMLLRLTRLSVSSSLSL